MYTINIKDIKSNLRKHYRKIRTNMNLLRKRYLDFEILNNVVLLNEYKKSNIVFIYVSKEIEVDTLEIIDRAFKDGKKVAVPRCVIGERSMDFYIIKSINDLEKGSFGVLEPIVSQCQKITDLSKGFCIVPGFCFDKEGYRLGYGKGYYDRFLSDFKGVTAGICYSNCIEKYLPHGYFDRPMDFIITERYIMKIKNSKTS